MFKFRRRSKTEVTAPVLQYEMSLLSDVGCHRTINQDSGDFVIPDDPKIMAEKGCFMVVADGVGGHQAGEVASKLAVSIIIRKFYEENANPNAALVKACQLANREIFAQAAKDESLSGMGTTCVALVLRGGVAWACHVGDSRLYLIRDHGIYLMTQDDSAVMELVKQGILSLSEARHHADKNVILRALGTHPEVSVTVWDEPFPLRPGDRFLLCSDGLTDMVEDDEIRRLATNEDLRNACGNLIELAKNRGGYDNITVGLVLIKAEEASRPRETREARAL
jgi:serine/threonine protein phosphatase PrpC